MHVAMWNSLEGAVKKGLDKGLDFVKKVTDQPSPVPVSSDGVFVTYTLKEAADSIDHMIESCDVEGSVFFVPKKSQLTVKDVKQYFPIPGPMTFRFKLEDDLFDFVWIESLPDSVIVPLYRGNLVLQVLRLPVQLQPDVSAEARSAQEQAPPQALPSREELIRQRQEAEAAVVMAARQFAHQNAADEKQRRDDKISASNFLGPELDKWALTEQGKFKDVRSLLSSMASVLWANSGWTEVPMGELMMSDAAVKKSYRKAIILCHPDKHQSASAEQQYRADRIFNAINESYKLFTS